MMPKLTAEVVIQMVGGYYGLSVEEMKRQSNTARIAFPRQVAMYLIRELTALPYPRIGRVFGGKHHTTVLYAMEKISERRQKNPALDQLLHDFATKLRESYEC